MHNIRKLFRKKQAKQSAQRRQGIFLRIISLLVVLGTVWAMILPGVAMEQGGTCALETHTHTETCYSCTDTGEKQTLVCSLEALGIHQHTVECANIPDGCKFADYVVHTHDESCMDGDELVCSLPEIKAHAHSEECYSVMTHSHIPECFMQERGEMVCLPEEGEEHTHTDACYEMMQVNLCGMEEGEEIPESLTCVCARQEILLHTHSESCEGGWLDEQLGWLCPLMQVTEHIHGEGCFETVPAEANCGLEADETHTHSSMCYGTWELTCGKEEHIHTEECKVEEETLPEESIPESAPETTTETTSAAVPEETAEEVRGGAAVYAPLRGEVFASGEIAGSDYVWAITKDVAGEYTLTIDGTGPMPGCPWINSGIGLTPVHVVLGENVTTICNRAFSNMWIASIDFGGVQTIKSGAFSYGRGDAVLTIPGTVKTLEAGCFTFNYLVREVILEEGVETIVSGAVNVGLDGNMVGKTVYIPASVTSIGGNAFSYVREYVVHPDNPNYCAIDGVLYTKDGKGLVDYPALKVAEEFTVPDHVETIHGGALGGVKNVKRIYIPNTVKSIPSRLFENSAFEEIYFADGIEISGTQGWFAGMYNLRVLELPKDTAICINNSAFLDGQPKISQWTIPAGVYHLQNYEPVIKNLTELRYDARNAYISDNGNIQCENGYTLTLGSTVENLQAGFRCLAENMTGLYFDSNAPFHFTAAQNAFTGGPEALDALTKNGAASLYVDAQGLLYSYNADAKTADLVYCPPNVEQAVIPGSIPVGEEEYPVTRVSTNAFKQASALTRITFEAPENILALENYAFANAQNLAQVNGKITEAEAAASFPNAAIGSRAFYNTALEGAEEEETAQTDMTGKENLTVTIPGADTMTIEPNLGSPTLIWSDSAQIPGAGGYRLLTGANLEMNVIAGNTAGNSNMVYRVYLQSTNNDFIPGIQPGEEKTYDGQKITCFATDDPYTVYIEFVPAVGETRAIPLSVTYPSPDSAGGGLRIWGTISTRDEAEATAGMVVPGENEIRAWWTTQANPYQLVKTGTVKRNVVGDGTGNARISGGIAWSLAVNRDFEEANIYGQDFVQYMEVTDVVTLPQGMSWDPWFLENIKAGNYKYVGTEFFIGNTKIGNLFHWSGRVYLSQLRMQWDDALQTVVFRWRVSSRYNTSELSNFSFGFELMQNVILVDMDVYDPSQTYEVENTATMEFHYMHNQPQTSESSCTTLITGGDSKLYLSKYATSAKFLGEDICYTIEYGNSGAINWMGKKEVYYLEDDLDSAIYISLQGMDKMFDEVEPGTLTIQITDALLGQRIAVTDAFGGASWQYPGNSAMGTTGNTLVITNPEAGVVALTVTDAAGVVSQYTGDSVTSLLESIGFGLNRYTDYFCKWALNAENEQFVVLGGEKRIFHVYATAKNTFGLLTEDNARNYYQELTRTENYAIIQVLGAKVIDSEYCQHELKLESYIGKEIFHNGEPLEDGDAVGNREILDYVVNFTHHGKGEFTDLPMVDEIRGNQYLLVPVHGNEALADRDLEIVTDGGLSWYVLTEGSYTDISVGVDDGGNLLIAASVEVQDQGEEGVYTCIKWYFAHMDGGNYCMSITYQTLTDLYRGTDQYHLSNTAWVNDRPGQRIYTGTGVAGVNISYEKNIVTQRGSLPEEDVIDPDDYCPVEEGQSIIYRLTLENETERAMGITGDNLADGLPETYHAFSWQKDENVELLGVVASGETVQYSGLENWHIGDAYKGLYENRQYILWDADTSVTLQPGEKLWIYFRLTYPQNDEDGDIWSLYTYNAKGERIRNTMYVRTLTDSVSHNLVEMGQVVLQKGVYGNFYHKDAMYSPWRPSLSRKYYNNQDLLIRGTAYYVVLYNGGNNRLYIKDLYDCLPEGFTYQYLLAQDNIANVPQNQQFNITTLEGTQLPADALVQLDVQGAPPLFRSAYIQATPTSQGVRFTLSAGEGEYPLRYDEIRRQYYLERGEAVTFGYLCAIGEESETEDVAENVIYMAYSDYLGWGVEQMGDGPVSVTAGENPDFTDENDGHRDVMTGAALAQSYGVQNVAAGEYLVSAAAMERGTIVPGISKVTNSYIPANSDKKMTYVNQVSPSDSIVWKVQLQNNGTRSMIGYTFTDIMPAPYAFEGRILGRFYDSYDNLLEEWYLPAILPRSENDEKLLLDDGTTLVIGGGERKIKSGVWVSIDRDEMGNEVLQLRVETVNMSIPEGGRLELEITGRNPTTHFENKVFTNRAILTPEWPFEKIGWGTMIRDDQGVPMAVESSAPVTVNFGYSTSSVKGVSQTADPENAALSTDAQENWILVEPGSRVTYDLTVGNDTDYAMTKLVLIDNLPREGDHSPFDPDVPRGSAFAVILAEAPNFRVRIEPAEGESYLLSEEFWRVEYTRDTDFGGAQSNDWKDAADTTANWIPAEEWTESLEAVKAVRIVLEDAAGTQIPAKAEITVSFEADVDAGAEPGTIAWNNFGYHYALKDVAAQMEAMPLNVGVRIPLQPVLRKVLVDDHGPAAARQDETFSFLLYEGRPVSVGSDEELKTVLEAAGRAFTQMDVTVKAGETTSEPVILDWQWQEGAVYTLTELQPRWGIATEGFGESGNNTFSFVYDPLDDLQILCQNRLEEWQILVNKQNKPGEDAVRLPGALFGLFSPEAADQMLQSQAGSLPLTAEKDGQVWYLAAIGTTDEQGQLLFDGLIRECYYLRELQAPAGYYQSWPGAIIARKDATDGEYALEAVNDPGVVLPRTGGMGTELFQMLGILLMGAALVSGLVFLRRRKVK